MDGDSKLITSLSKYELKHYISKQLDNLFPDKYKFVGSDVDSAIDIALQRSETCFKYVNLPHYNRDGEIWFDHLHSDQYSTFIYFLSNSLWEISQNKPLCDKCILLNKTLNSFFISYKCKMPKIFLLIHPIGTIIGNAEYQDFLVILQNVTINTETPPPHLGKGVFMAAGSSVIGSSQIGDFSSLGIGTTVYKTNIPENSIAYTDKNGEFHIKKSHNITSQSFFNINIMSH
jgi:serine O-acetyltransferase